MRHPAFVAGDYDTGFIERHKARADAAPGRRGDRDAGRGRRRGAGAAEVDGERPTLDLSQTQLSAWRRDTKD